MTTFESWQPVGRVGTQTLADGENMPFRQGRGGELIHSQLRGRYAESSERGKLYYAANQAAATWSVALNTTHTGFVVYNPITSTVNLSILAVSFALSVAPAGIAHIGLFGGGNTAGIATHTTPLTPAGLYLGQAAGQAGADAAATLVGTPVWLMPFMGGFTAGALPSTSPVVIDIGGAITVPPGYYCGVGALTAAVGFAGMWWEEVPRP